MLNPDYGFANRPLHVLLASPASAHHTTTTLVCDRCKNSSGGLSSTVRCCLTIKKGEALSRCRDKGRVALFDFTVSDGYSVLLAKIASQFESAVRKPLEPTTIVYLKPSNNAPQKLFQPVACADQDLIQQIEMVWRRARLRKRGRSEFELELFVYTRRPAPSTTIRRATQPRIQEQIPRVAELLRERQVSTGPATTLYMATSTTATGYAARCTTFQQLQYIDEQQRIIDENTAAAVEMHSNAYPLIHIMLHDVEVPVSVNVRDLRRVLGLPEWNLLPPFRAPTRDPVGSPLSASADIDDEEHKDDEDFLFESEVLVATATVSIEIHSDIVLAFGAHVHSHSQHCQQVLPECHIGMLLYPSL
jgi:hypothetical protein